MAVRTVLLMLVAGACYAPSIPTGTTCAGGEACPRGQVCSPATQTCELEVGSIDAPRAGDGGLADADADADASANADARACFGTGLVSVCLAQSPPETFSFGARFDTSADCVQVVAGTPELCVIAAAAVHVPESTTVVGARPLVIVGTQSVDVSGTLSVASYRGGSSGPGSRATCAGGVPPVAGPGNEGGGYGGTFSGAGGNGGAELPTAAGGVAAMADTQSMFLGGCSGSDGGSGGNRGAGGGAVAVLAGASIEIVGVINASGAGGRSCPNPRCGGGGGGSGGIVVLDAPMITLAGSGQVFANGGGGGESNGFGSGGVGRDGQDPTSALVPAAGGGAGTTGTNGAGGAGSSGPVRTGGNGEDSSYGGGGGGGGAGWILVYGTSNFIGAISPPPS